MTNRLPHRLPIPSKNPEPAADTRESPSTAPRAPRKSVSPVDRGDGLATDGGSTAREHEHRARSSAAALVEHARRTDADPVALLAVEIVGDLARVARDDGYVWVCEDHGRRRIEDDEAIICRTVEQCVRSEEWNDCPCGHVVCADCRAVLREREDR